MRKAFCFAAVFLCSGPLASRARADVITYSFTGVAVQTGAPLSGSFTYNATPALPFSNYGEPGITWETASSTSKVNTFGTLSWTFNGLSFSATSIIAQALFDYPAVPNFIGLLGSNYIGLEGSSSAGEYLSLQLISPGVANISSAAALPRNFQVNSTGGTFGLGTTGVIPGIRPATKVGIPDFVDGSISSFALEGSAASLAPEPGSLILAGPGAMALVFGGWCRRRIRFGAGPIISAATRSMPIP